MSSEINRSIHRKCCLGQECLSLRILTHFGKRAPCSNHPLNKVKSFQRIIAGTSCVQVIAPTNGSGAKGVPPQRRRSLSGRSMIRKHIPNHAPYTRMSTGLFQEWR
jgi:hypothetical protein